MLNGKNRFRDGATIAAAAAAAVLATAGIAAASVSAPSSTSPATIVLHGQGGSATFAAPPASPAIAGTEHFQLVATNPSSSTAPVIAYGLFTGAAVDHQGNRVDRFVFRNGSFKVRHSPGKGPQSFNPKTCLMTISQHGTYKIIGGTGRYAGITGHGIYHVTLLLIAARSKGKCSQSKPPVAFQQIIRASGPVTL